MRDLYANSGDKANPLHFRSPLAPKILVGSENVWKCKNARNKFYLRAKFGGDLPPHYGVIRKSLEPFCLSGPWT